MKNWPLYVGPLLMLLGLAHADEASPAGMSRAMHATFEDQATGIQPALAWPIAGSMGRRATKVEVYKKATITIEDRPEFGGKALFFDDHISNRKEVTHTRAAAWFRIADAVSERALIRFRFMFLKDPRNCFFTVQGESSKPVFTVMARADRKLVVLSKRKDTAAQIVHPEALRSDQPSDIKMEVNLRAKTWILGVNCVPLSGELDREAADSFYALQISSTHGGTVQFAVDDVVVEVPSSEFRAESIVRGEDLWQTPLPGTGITLTTLERYPSPAAQWTFSTTNFSLSSIVVTQTGSNLLSRPGGIFLRDGESNAVLSPKTERISQENGRLVVSQGYAGSLQSTATVSAEREMIRWRLDLTNASAHARRIELHLALPLAAKSKALYFDGYATREIEAATLWRTQLEQTLPVSFLYHAGENGLAFGVPPDTTTSLLHNGWRDGAARYLTRLVVPPGHPVAFEFILFTSGSTFGFRDAVQGYYQRYPEAFRPFPGIDPRMTDGKRSDSLQMNHYHGGASHASKATDIMGSYGGIEWGYAVSKRGGDLYGHPEFWAFDTPADLQTKMDNRFKASGGLLNFSDCHKYHEGKRTLWERANYRGNVALTHFMIDYVEEGMASTFDLRKCAYPDGDDVPELRSTWGFEYCSRLYHVYPWANAYETLMQRDIPLLVKELNLPGIAHDMFSEGPSAPLYRGPLDRYMPGWSYDSQGECLSRLLAYRKIPELCHALTNDDGHAVGVFANGIGLATALSFASPDCWLTETRPTLQFLENVSGTARWGRANYKHARCFAGSKPVYQHAGLGSDLGDLVDWETLPPDYLCLLVDDFYRDLVSWYYQAGVLPASIYIACSEAVRNETHWIHDVLSRGFQPAPILAGDAALERVRYGEGLQSAVVLSSRANKHATFRETVINAYLGHSYAIPLLLKGGSLPFSLLNGNTLFDTPLDPLENKIVTLNVALALPAGSSAHGESQTTTTPTERRYRIVVQMTQDIRARFSVSADPGYAVASVACNGKPPEGDQIPLRAGENVLSITTTSTEYLSPMAAFAAFPYETAPIVIVGPASKRKSAAAQNLQDFLLVRRKVTADIRTERPASGPAFLIGTAEDFGRAGVWLADNALIISGQDPFDAQQRAWFFMRFLERHNPLFLPPRAVFLGGTKETQALFKKAALYGKPIPRLDRTGQDRFPWQAYLRADLRAQTN